MSQYRIFGDVKSDAYQDTPMSTEPTPPQPEPPTDTERAHAFEWLRKLGLEGTTQEARLAYVAMLTMLKSAEPPTTSKIDENERDRAYIDKRKTCDRCGTPHTGDHHCATNEPQSVFLRHVLDESHAGCIKGCLHCGEINELAVQEAREFKADQHYAGYNSAIEGEPQQSAVEWVKERFFKLLGGGQGLIDTNALERARQSLSDACDRLQAEIRGLKVELAQTKLERDLEADAVTLLTKRPPPLPRPDKPGWWWKWSDDATPPRWLPINVIWPHKNGNGQWLPATPPPAPKEETK